jgi:flavin reductase ActVB
MESTLDPAEFREALARFATGVTIVATDDAAGSAVGFTASAFSSLSLEPPLILVCLQKNADCYQAFMEATYFTVSVLAAGQGEIARRFATKGADKWTETPRVSGPATGLALVDGAASRLECRIHERFDGGDHTILIGEVLWADCAETIDPLLHFNRSFGRFVPDSAL